MIDELSSVKDEKRRKLNRKISGVIQEDKIWEQWYSEEAMEKEFPHMNQLDYLYSCIGEEPERIIINNRGVVEFTVRQLFEMIDKYKKAFASYNFKVGDVICTVGLTTPEMYAIKYAATALGLITCNLNAFDVEIFDNGVNRLLYQMKHIQPQMIFVMDYFEDRISKIVNNKLFDSIVKVILPMDESFPAMNAEKSWLKAIRIVNRINHKNIINAITLKTFLKKGNKVNKVPKNIYEKGLPCNIAFTSGTTGINKAVLLSHDANNALAFQQKIGDFGFTKNEKQLALVPPFLAFWDADVVHTVLCMGGINMIEVELSYDKIPVYVKKHMPQIGIWSQYLWDSIIHMPGQELKQVTHELIHAIVGGERCEVNELREFYNKTGIIQMAGYGASEVNTTFSISHPSCHKIGTAGIPLPFNNVKILDENGKNVRYGQPGRLYVTGPCMMNGYYKREDLTASVITKDETGILWYDTKDYAMVDTDGCLTVLDRDAAPITVVYNGKTEKVKLLDINEIIIKNKYIKMSKLNSKNGKIFMYLIIDPFCKLPDEQAIEEIKIYIKEQLEEKYWPDMIVLFDEFPRTMVGKVDYNKLNEYSEELVKRGEKADKLTVTTL